MSQNLVSNFVHKPAVITIASDDDLSAAVDCLGLVLIGLKMPAAWTAGDITFHGSIDGSAFAVVMDEDGTAITITGPAADELLMLKTDTPLIGGLTHLKVASSVGQAADRTVWFIFLVPNA